MKPLKIKIDRNVPMPTFKDRAEWSFLKKLQIGDSFEIPSSQAISVQIAARNLGMKLSWRMTTSCFMRVWRIA